MSFIIKVCMPTLFLCFILIISAIQLCQPNPCLHGGKCFATSKYGFKCDCRNTGYVGEKCQFGIVEFQSFPTLQTKIARKFVLSVKPDQELKIEPKVPNQALIFNPKTIHVIHPKTQASFVINTTNSVGRIRVSFNIFGVSAGDFLVPPSIVIRVVPSSFISLNRPIQKDVYIKQCHENVIDDCGTSQNIITLQSSCTWNGMATTGHVSVGTKSLRVPFSVSGFTGERNQEKLNEGNYFSPRADIMYGLHNDLTNGGSGKCAPDKCHTHLSKEEHEYALQCNLFVKSVLNQVSSLSPWWMKLFVDPSYKGFDISNFQSLVFKGTIRKNLATCPNMPELPNSTYSIFTSQVPINVQLMSTIFKIEKISTSCVVIDLCKNIYYMSLPVTRSIDVSKSLQDLYFKKTYLGVSGLSISQGIPVGTKCLITYAADGSLYPKCISGNIWSKFTLERRKRYFNLSFDGDAVINATDVNKVIVI